MFIFFIIAGMIATFAIILLLIRIQYLRKGVLAEATVIDFNFVKGASSEDHDSYYVTYKFYTQNNEEVTFELDRGSRNNLQIGDKVSLVYQTYNPQHVVILTYWDAFWEVNFLFCIALILILIAAGYYWSEHFFNSLTYHRIFHV